MKSGFLIIALLLVMAVIISACTDQARADDVYSQGLGFNAHAQYDRALDCFNRSLEMNADSSEVWLARSVTLYNLQRYSEAKISVDRSLELDPGSAAARSMKIEIESVLRNISSAQCPVSIGPGQMMIINETRNNATICASLDSSLVIRLTDADRPGGVWSFPPTSGIKISDEGTVWYNGNGTATGIPGTGVGIHSWNVRATGEGIHKIVATREFPGGEVTGAGRFFYVTVVVK